MFLDAVNYLNFLKFERTALDRILSLVFEDSSFSLNSCDLNLADQAKFVSKSTSMNINASSAVEQKDNFLVML